MRFDRIVRAWQGPGGYGQVLNIGMPLVMSMISGTVMQFTDRVFLANYSLETIAAALPASITSFLFVSFFMGVAEYVSVFVAQYVGAGRRERVGAAVWQGLWFCVPAWLTLALLGLAGNWIFSWAGHPRAIYELEVVYFQILSFGSGFGIVSAVLSCFYSGRGLTKAVMLVNMLGAVVNVPLDYVLIYGVGPFPELGIVGAGLATVFGFALSAVLFAVLVFRRENETGFLIRSNWRPDFKLFARLMRYGLPGGVQFFVDMFGITVFVFLIGRLGTSELAATNIVISLDMVGFLPCMGLHVATSVLVGQFLGANEPDRGERAARTAMQLNLFYMGCMSLLFLFAPRLLLELFRPLHMADATFDPVLDMGTVMLRFVAAYSLLDGMVLIYGGALKGAGDTRFVMWTIACCSLGIMVVPLYITVEWLGSGYVVPWLLLTLYILVLTILFRRRFRGGKWRGMRVIEDAPGPEGARPAGGDAIIRP